MFLICIKTFLIADMQNVLVEHEMFEKFGGGEMSKQGQAVFETILCQAHSAGRYCQAFSKKKCLGFL